MSKEFRVLETGNRDDGGVVLGVHVVDVDGPMKIFAANPVPLSVEGETYAEAFDRLKSLLAECNAAMDKPSVSYDKEMNRVIVEREANENARVLALSS